MAILHCHREQTDAINLEDVGNLFIAKNDIRVAAFASFPKHA